MIEDLSFLEQLGLPSFVKALAADCVFLTDEDIKAYLKDAVPNHSCTFKTVDDTIPQIEGFQKAYVFCRHGELGLSRKLRRINSDVDTYSVTYELLPKRFASGRDEQRIFQYKGNQILLAAPGSGYQNFVALLKNAQVANFKEDFDPSMLRWAGEVINFSVLRFINGSAQDNDQAAFNTQLTTDVCLALINANLIRLDLIMAWIEKFEVSILYYTNRDICAEAVESCFLKGTVYRHIDEVPERERIKITAKDIDESVVFQSVETLLQSEAILEPQLEKLARLKYVTQWDLHQNAKRVAENVALFMGGEVNGHISKPKVNWLAETDEYQSALKALKQTITNMIK